MNVINPTNTNHTIRFIPRFYPTGAIVFTLRNEFTDVSAVIANSYVITNGYLFLTFDKSDFVERDRFQVTIKENDIVVYRGLMFATVQDTQQFELSEGVYL
tara:strand:+ start:183 stop:485 length:303 start_codon:yes stop_codon:yes gene_type:complete